MGWVPPRLHRYGPVDEAHLRGLERQRVLLRPLRDVLLRYEAGHATHEELIAAAKLYRANSVLDALEPEE